MLRGSWHYVAISAVVSALTIISHNYTFVFLWLSFYVYLYINKRMSTYLLLFSTLVFMFFLFYIPSIDDQKQLLSKIKEGNVTVNGKISGQVKITENSLQFPFYVPEKDVTLLAIYFIKNHELDTYRLHELVQGLSCEIKGEIKHPDRATNPYQFDYQNYLLQQGITSQLIISSSANILCTTNESFISKLNFIRNSFIHLSSENLHPEVAKWQQALVLGFRDHIDEHILDLFERWGLSHLLAISGLHIGIIMLLFMFVLVHLSILTKEKTQWLIVIFLPIYAIIAGNQPSVWRASLMGVVAILLYKRQKLKNMTDLLSILFLVFLIVNKWIIYHIGFQFSFAVTFGLLLTRKLINETKSRFFQLLLISFVAQMMIVPLQMYYFYHFQPLSILLNVLIVPYFSFFVIPYMFFMLFGHFFPNLLLNIFETLFIFVHQSVLSVIAWIDQYFNYPFITGEITLVNTIIYYIFFFGMMIFLEKKERKKAFLHGTLLTILLTVIISKPYITPYGTVTMLDIGQGDAFVIELPYRKGIFMIDAGATFNFSTEKMSNRVVKQVIEPYLKGRGIDSIDVIFVSHNDVDHDGSISFLANRLEIGEIIVHHTYQGKENLQTWQDKGIKITVVDTNEKIVRNGHTFYILAPITDRNDNNENSLVLYTKFGGKRWLFTGDIGRETEKEVVRKYNNLNVDVLKVGHHGSNTSTDPLFIEQINASYGLISVGRNNRYGHPSKEVINTLLNAQMTILRTDENGAVQFYFSDKRGTFHTFLR